MVAWVFAEKVLEAGITANDMNRLPGVQNGQP